jgi:hypothetical protein
MMVPRCTLRESRSQLAVLARRRSFLSFFLSANGALIVTRGPAARCALRAFGLISVNIHHLHLQADV